MAVQLVAPYFDPATWCAPWPPTPITHVPSPGHLPIPIEQAGAEIEAVVLHHTLVPGTSGTALRQAGYYLCVGPLREALLPLFPPETFITHRDQYTVWARVVPHSPGPEDQET